MNGRKILQNRLKKLIDNIRVCMNVEKKGNGEFRSIVGHLRTPGQLLLNGRNILQNRLKKIIDNKLYRSCARMQRKDSASAV